MPRKRAINVCESCHIQKIRCDIDLVGAPCSKCAELRQACNIRARKQYRGRKRIRRPSTLTKDEHDGHVPAKIVAAAVLAPTSRIAPIFVGEGGYGAILDATAPTSDRHFHIPTTAERKLDPEDLEYLKVKGCFTLPVESQQLIESYFRFVHPTFPVIDALSFLSDYATGGLHAINLLLLWSMFAASASYLPDLPRKSLKETFTQRAKLLFDLSQETDKTVLIQSALLLSFWFEDTEDVKQSWYWTSIAFSIAQSLGLHQSKVTNNTQLSGQQALLWRNLWHCCMIRDVWQAFGMGRPLRINASDCDFISPGDADHPSNDLKLHERVLYAPNEVLGMLSGWKHLITTSNILREVITSKTLSSTRYTALKDQINVRDFDNSTFLLKHIDRHLRLHQYATLAALARARKAEEDLSRAGDNTTAILREFLSDNNATYAAPVTVPLVVPAMTFFLAKSKGDQEARLCANIELRTIAEFLRAIKNNYPAASILDRVLAAARNAITRNQPQPTGLESGDAIENNSVHLLPNAEWFVDAGLFRPAELDRPV